MATASSASRTWGQSAVRLGVHGDGVDAEPTARADDPAGDLPPVGDQDAAEHCGQAGGSGSRPTASTASARQPSAVGAQRVRRVTAPLRPAARTPSSRILIDALVADLGEGDHAVGLRPEAGETRRRRARGEQLGREPARQSRRVAGDQRGPEARESPLERLGHRPAGRRLLEADELLRIVVERRGGRRAVEMGRRGQAGTGDAAGRAEEILELRPPGFAALREPGRRREVAQDRRSRRDVAALLLDEPDQDPLGGRLVHAC